MKYRKRPVVIEAYQYAGGMLEPGFPKGWLNTGHRWSSDGVILFIDTLEGRMNTYPGDYIIKGVKGEFYPCRQDIFLETYLQVPEVSESILESRLGPSITDQLEALNKEVVVTKNKY